MINTFGVRQFLNLQTLMQVKVILLCVKFMEMSFIVLSNEKEVLEKWIPLSESGLSCATDTRSWTYHFELRLSLASLVFRETFLKLFILN